MMMNNFSVLLVFFFFSADTKDVHLYLIPSFGSTNVFVMTKCCMYLRMEQHLVLDGIAQDVNEWRICCVMTFPSLRKNTFHFCEYEHF